MMKKLLFPFLLMCFKLSAQVTTPSWGVEDTVLNIVKTTDFGIVHDYLEIFNYSNQDLDMRWIPSAAGNWPTQWIADFTDPDSLYIDPHLEDSADFVLLNPPGFSNKLIISVDHQSFVANSVMSFKVFPVSHPEDSLWLHYKIYIGEPEELAIEEVDSKINCNYNNQLKQIEIASDLDLNKIVIYNLKGEIVHEEKLCNQLNSILSVSHLQSGVFIATILQDQQEIIKRFKFQVVK